MNDFTHDEQDKTRFVAIETAEEIVISIKQEDVMKEQPNSHITLQIYYDDNAGQSVNEQATQVQSIQSSDGSHPNENNTLATPKNVSVTLTQIEYLKSEQEKTENENCDNNASSLDSGDVINIEPKQILPVYPEDEHCYHNSTLQEDQEVHGSINTSKLVVLDARNNTPIKGVHVFEFTPEGTLLQPVQSKEFMEHPVQGNKNRSLFKCTECPSDFYDITRLKDHLRHIHNKEFLINCPECGLEFDSRTHLKNHLGREHNKTPWQCEFCPMTFADSWHLGRHTTTHEESNNFRCTVCNKGFQQRHVLDRHMVVGHISLLFLLIIKKV